MQKRVIFTLRYPQLTGCNLKNGMHSDISFGNAIAKNRKTFPIDSSEAQISIEIAAQKPKHINPKPNTQIKSCI